MTNKLLHLFIFIAISISVFSITNEEKAKKLLSRMTLEEKLGQMNQLNFSKIDTILTNKIIDGQIGSLLNVTDPIVINKIQKIAIEKSRLGIPLIFGRDIIHGFKTIFPIPLGQASSFNPNLVLKCARAAATEAREQGITWTFAPMLDISRDARWGRIAESLGEDPYLTGQLGAAMIQGFQGEKLSEKNSIAACAKHFAGYGAAEGGRDYNSTNIPPLLMRNIYLPPFQKAVNAGVATVMTAFNDNDGIPSSANNYLLRDILRKEWKFDGFVVSDWESMSEMMIHGFAENKKEVAQKSLKAGVDMEMVSGTYLQFLKELLKDRKISIRDIDKAVLNILRIKYRLGLFDKPYVEEDKNISSSYSPEHLFLARQAAVESAVLLKNSNNVLPLNLSDKIAIFGPMANAPHDQLGTWSFDGNANMTITPLKAFQTEYSNINYVYEAGLTYSRDNNTCFEKAMEIAKSADVAVVFVGEEAILSGEAHSLSNINLIGQQSELLKAINSTGKPVVMVVMAGRPLTIERDLKYVDAVLYSFHPGTMGGLAIIDLLFGKANPSGKLPVTFVREVGQIPMYYNHNNTGRPAPEYPLTTDKIPVGANQTSLGNTSYYLDSGKEPLFSFGFGLSYSKFEYSNLILSSSSLKKNEALTVKTTIKNTSNIDGAEVVQLYIQDVIGSIVRPVKELKGFNKIHLKAGESKVIEFSITRDQLSFYGRNMKKNIESGEYNLWVGPNSKDGLKAVFTLE